MQHAVLRQDMAHSITLGQVAARTDTLAKMRDVMHAQVGDCAKRNDMQIQNRCDPYCPDLVRLFY
jgi:hypothetical protein